jgi:hypothetical protein
MGRIGLVLIMAGLILAVAIFGYNRIPDEEAMSYPEQEAAANSPRVLTENETEIDETRLEVVATEEPDVPLETSPGEGAETAPADMALLTVDGYDPQRVRYMMQESDMPIELRNDYLTRLETAYGDDDALAAVLAQLRADLQDG